MQEPSFSTEALTAEAQIPHSSPLDDQINDQMDANDQRDGDALAGSETGNGEIKSNESSNEIKDDEIKSDRIAGDEIKADEIKNDGTENHAIQQDAAEHSAGGNGAEVSSTTANDTIDHPASETHPVENDAIETTEREGALAIEVSPIEQREQIHEYRWRWKDTPIKVVYEVAGTGHPILLLPAFSSVSSREEMRGLVDRLSPYFQVYALDWVGFGESARPAMEYEPKLYQKFLKDFVQDTFTQPVVVIAAGHTAGYVMRLAHQNPNPWAWVVLVAPTWRGPLPTMMGEKWRWFNLIRKLVRSPVLGQLLYALNTTKGFLRWMYRRHVFSDRRNISRELIQQKWRTTHQPGARFASAAFVTGGLDPVRQRSAFFDYFDPMRVPVLVVIGEQAPPRSLEEMEVLAHFSKVQSYRMPGALSPHEEYPDKLVEGILPFLKKFLS